MRSRPRGDEGVTLIELVVVMTVMTIFLAIFTAGIVRLSRTSTRVEAGATGQSQLDIAFMRLAEEIHYASQMSQNGTVNSDAYIEYLTLGSGTRTCVELRVHVASGQLQRRTWTQGAAPLTPTPWRALASGVSPWPGVAPFTPVAADPTYNLRRLRVRLAVTTGGDAQPVTRQSDVTFTALNSSPGAADPTVCTEGRSVP